MVDEIFQHDNNALKKSVVGEARTESSNLWWLRIDEVPENQRALFRHHQRNKALPTC